VTSRARDVRRAFPPVPTLQSLSLPRSGARVTLGRCPPAVIGRASDPTSRPCSARKSVATVDPCGSAIARCSPGLPHLEPHPTTTHQERPPKGPKKVCRQEPCRRGDGLDAVARPRGGHRRAPRRVHTVMPLCAGKEPCVALPPPLRVATSPSHASSGPSCTPPPKRWPLRRRPEGEGSSPSVPSRGAPRDRIRCCRRFHPTPKGRGRVQSHRRCPEPLRFRRLAADAARACPAAFPKVGDRGGPVLRHHGFDGRRLGVPGKGRRRVAARHMMKARVVPPSVSPAGSAEPAHRIAATGPRPGGWGGRAPSSDSYVKERSGDRPVGTPTYRPS
jgi:hypothetical protein